MRQKYKVQWIQLLEHWLCSMQFRFVLEKQALYEHWPMQLWVLQPFGAHVMDLLSTLLRCHGLIRIHWSCSRSDKQQTTQLWLWPSYGASLALESTLDSLQSNHCAGHQQLSYLIHFSITHHSLIKKWFIIVGKKKRCTNSKHFSKKKCSANSWGIHLPSFSAFPICFKCQMTMNGPHWLLWQLLLQLKEVQPQWLLSVDHCQLLMANHTTPQLQDSWSLCKPYWTTTAVCEPNVLLKLPLLPLIRFYT